MDKSKSDWQQFKRSDDKLEVELELHKRSGDQVRTMYWGRRWAAWGWLLWCAGTDVPPAASWLSW